MEDGQEGTVYFVSVTNHSLFPDALFAAAPDLPPCGLNEAASRTWVDIFDDNGARLHGHCGLYSAGDLAEIAIIVPSGGAVPDSVYITLTDRRCGITYTSNLPPTR